MRLFFWLVLWALVPGAVWAESDAARFATVYRLPPWIDAVFSVCPWRDGEQSGFIRLLRSRENDGQRLYLQWVDLHKPDNADSTRRIDEQSQHEALIYSPPAWLVAAGVCTLQMTAHPPLADRIYEVEVRLGPPGQYQYLLTRPITAPGDVVIGTGLAITPDSADPDGCADDPCPGDVADSQNQKVHGRPVGMGLRYR